MYSYLLSLISFPGLNWFTEAQHPCRTAHHLTLMQKHPADMRTLSFDLPHPFYSDQIGVRYLNDAEIGLTLFKALDEPWPSEFTSRPEWSVDYLPPWPLDSSLTTKSGSTDLIVHLERQFDAPSKKLNPYPYPALDQVRQVITDIFNLVVGESHYFMTIRCLESEKVPAEVVMETEPDWLIRVDQAIVRSPQGVPMLLISAFDHQRALELIQKDDATVDEVESEAFRLFFNKIPDGTVVNSFLLCSREASNLFRCILRLNATKISPSRSQIENKITAENSPWLATFLSPRYSYRAPSVSDTLSTVKKRMSHLKCAYCKRVSEQLKCCQSCGVSHYCSTKCQQEDLDEHTVICDFLGSRYKKTEPRY